METIMNGLAAVSDVLWGPWTPWVLLGAGLLFTIWSRFTQATAMTHGFAVVRGKYDDPDDPGAINHFEALSAALSATVGLGNIGGVALAIGIGGPGALFWMWIVGLLGMALKSVEITLAMMYRNVDDPENPHGGAMWVVDKVIGGKGGAWVGIAKAIGIFFCITLLISSFTGGNMFQAWSVSELTAGYFGVSKWTTGIIMAVLVGLVIIGGIKRIGNVAGKLVPFMCVTYLIAAFAVLGVHINEIPAMFKLVFTSAFSPTEAGGAFLGGSMGFAFMEGMKRALFSNEAGQGSAPIAHAAAKTAEPAREGIVGGLGPFIDTICICTVTAMVILSTGTWNRAGVGEIQGDVGFTVQEATAESNDQAVTLTIPTAVSSLPSVEGETWKEGDKLYLVAAVEGATHIKSERNHVPIEGKIVENKEAKDGDPETVIEWADLQLSTKDWTAMPTGIALVNKQVHRNYGGANLTGHAFDRAFPGLGKWLVTLAAWLFALSTMISWSYYGEQGVVFIFGNGKPGILLYKLLFLVAVVYAAVGINSTEDMIILMDVGTGAMLWSNLPIVIGLGYLAIGSLNTYRDKLKAGEFKRID